jgi:hypothetical protein
VKNKVLSNIRKERMIRFRSIFLIIITAVCISILSGCQTSQTGSITGSADEIEEANREFLEPDEDARETFRVLMTSKKYIVSQMKFNNTISRAEDKGGDEYMTEELKKFDIINEVKESVIKIWLYPDLPGRIMKIRPHQPAYLLEIDQLITEDIQRWNFEFPKKYVFPTNMFIRYRIVLQKKDEGKEHLRKVKNLMKQSATN